MIRFFILFSLTLPVQADGRSRDKRGDDVTLGSVIQEQASVIQELQAKQESLSNRISALESENAALKTQQASMQNRMATLSKAVAFTVRFSGDDVSHGIALGSHSILRFDAVISNTGGSYNPHTGVFTAPVTGTYSFFLNMMGAGGQSQNNHLGIVKNGANLDLVYSRNHEDQGSSQVTAHLRVGDEVWVEEVSGNAVRGAWYTIFTGYLLQAD